MLEPLNCRVVLPRKAMIKVRTMRNIAVDKAIDDFETNIHGQCDSLGIALEVGEASASCWQ